MVDLVESQVDKATKSTKVRGMNLGIELAERGLLPEPVVRAGIRSLLRRRLAAEAVRARAGGAAAFRRDMAVAPIALATDAANRQHY